MLHSSQSGRVVEVTRYLLVEDRPAAVADQNNIPLRVDSTTQEFLDMLRHILRRGGIGGDGVPIHQHDVSLSTGGGERGLKSLGDVDLPLDGVVGGAIASLAPL